MVRKIIVKKKYVHVRMPEEAYKNYVRRQQRMESVVKQITKKKIAIPLTEVFKLSSEASINLPDDYLISVAKRRKRRV